MPEAATTSSKESRPNPQIRLKEIITIIYTLELFKEEPMVYLNDFRAAQIFVRQMSPQGSFKLSYGCPEGSSEFLRDLAKIDIAEEEITSVELPEEERIEELVGYVSKILSQHSKTISNIKNYDLAQRIFEEIKSRMELLQKLKSEILMGS